MKSELVEDVVAHILAAIITLGFFATVLISLLGYVDLENPTISSFTGMLMGYIAGSLNTVLTRYFKKAPDETLENTLDMSEGQAPRRQEDL